MKPCDGTLGEDDLSPEGNDFAAAYDAADQCLNDDSNVLGGDVPTLYHANTWENYDLIAPGDRSSVQGMEKQGRIKSPPIASHRP